MSIIWLCLTFTFFIVKFIRLHCKYSYRERNKFLSSYKTSLFQLNAKEIRKTLKVTSCQSRICNTKYKKKNPSFSNILCNFTISLAAIKSTQAKPSNKKQKVDCIFHWTQTEMNHCELYPDNLNVFSVWFKRKLCLINSHM